MGTALLKMPLTRVERLAYVAYCSLAAHGKLVDPTLHDITHAVVQAAPLLNLSDTPDAIDIEMQAVKKLCEENDWVDNKKVVISLDHYARKFQERRRWATNLGKL